MISIYSKGHNKGYQEDLFGSELKDISTWTQKGSTEVSLSYDNGINTLIFGGIIASKLIAIIKSISQYHEIDLKDDEINREKISKIISDWKSSGRDLLFSRVHFQDVNAYCYCFFVSTDDQYSYSIDDNYYITITNGIIYREKDYSTGNDWLIDLNISNKTTYNCTHIPINFGKANDYEPNNKSYTVSFDMNIVAPITAERVIDVLNNSNIFVSTRTVLEKNEVNLSNINDLLSVWKSNDNYKLNAVFCGNNTWDTLYLTLYTGTCTVNDKNINWKMKRYQKNLNNGNWSTDDRQMEDTIYSNQITAEEFDTFSSFESIYSLPDNIPYLLTFDQKTSNGWETVNNNPGDFSSFEELADYLLEHYQNLDVINKATLVKDLETNASVNYNNAKNPYKVFILNERGDNVYNYLYIAIVSSDDSLYWDNNALKSDDKSSVVLYTIGYDGTSYNNQNTIELPLTFNTSYFHEAFIYSLNTDVDIDYNIVFTNGSDVYNIDLNNKASDTYRTFNILFTPTAKSSTLKLDLSAMRGTQINLQIKDISLYKIG